MYKVWQLKYVIYYLYEGQLSLLTFFKIITLIEKYIYYIIN